MAIDFTGRMISVWLVDYIGLNDLVYGLGGASYLEFVSSDLGVTIYQTQILDEFSEVKETIVLTDFGNDTYKVAVAFGTQTDYYESTLLSIDAFNNGVINLCFNGDCFKMGIYIPTQDYFSSTSTSSTTTVAPVYPQQPIDMDFIKSLTTVTTPVVRLINPTIPSSVGLNTVFFTNSTTSTTSTTTNTTAISFNLLKCPETGCNKLGY
jgi:hypothetical protein